MSTTLWRGARLATLAGPRGYGLVENGALVVHGDTLAVVARALDAWRQTGGRFDITMLPALLAHGYTHSAVDHSAAPHVPGSRIGMSAMVHTDYAASTLTDAAHDNPY